MSQANGRVLLLALLVAATVMAAPTHGQTVVSIGSATAAIGATAVVPIHVRAASDGLLGPSLPLGRNVQGFAFKVVYAPTSAVTSVKVRRAGVLAGLEPTFEISPRTEGSASLIVSFDESSQRVPLSAAADDVGDLVAEVEVTLAANVPDGTEVTLTLDRAVSALSNQAGTVVQTAQNGQLAQRDGLISVGHQARRGLGRSAPSDPKP